MPSIEGYSGSSDYLLEHSAWLKSLARSLVRDDATADDVLQDAWIASQSAAIREPKSWFRTVIRNLAFRQYRAESHRRQREVSVAQPELTRRDQGIEVVEKAETHSRLVDQLLKLDEPYRQTLLLRYFEDLSPKEIADKGDLPESTVRTRIQRGLKQLRDQLSQKDRNWRKSVLILAGVDPLNSSTQVAASTATAASASALTSTSIGAIIVSQKAILLSVTTIVAGVIGVSLGSIIFKSDPEDIKTANSWVDQSELTLAQDRVGELETELEKLRTASLDDKKRIGDLSQLVTTLQDDLKQMKETAQANADSEATEAVAKESSYVALGKNGGLDELKNADWETMSKAIHEMHDLFKKLNEGTDEEKQKAAAELATKNSSLIPFAVSLFGKLPTVITPGNGEFTHPVVTTNMIKSLLEQNNLPLSTEQIDQVSTLVQSYESEFDKQMHAFDDSTPLLYKMGQELALKDAFKRNFDEVLNDEQFEIVAIEGISNTLKDIYGGGLMAAGMGKPMIMGSKDDLVPMFSENMSKKYNLNEAQQQAMAPTFEAYGERVSKLVDFGKNIDNMSPESFSTYMDAQGTVYQEILKLEGLEDSVKQRVINGKSIIIPALKNSLDQ